MNSFFTFHIFLEVGKTQYLTNKNWQTLVDALIRLPKYQSFLRGVLPHGVCSKNKIPIIPRWHQHL
jgi:hypothetical protein